MAPASPPKTGVAIIGAGISGLILGLALHERKIPFQIYEQSASYNQFGAGLNMNPAGLRALRRASPAAFATFENVRTPHHPTRKDFYFAYTDGKKTFEILIDGDAGGLKRSRWIEELARIIPDGAVQFNKRLSGLSEMGEGLITLNFEDGTQSLADVVIACDGIKSMIRRQIVGTHPSANPSFAHVVAYRSLMSKTDARRLIGSELADAAHFRSGKGIGYVSYPITGGSHNNFGMFKRHEGEWPHYPKMSTTASKQQLLEGIEDSDFKALAESLSDELDVWAVYDMAQSPLPTFSKGRLALVGDAAHASTPNLGAGAGVSIEDAAVLSELLTETYLYSSQTGGSLNQEMRNALAVYSDSRIERSQWLVERSRLLGQANLGRSFSDKPWDFDTYCQVTESSYRTVWDGQIDDMVAKAKESLAQRMEGDGVPIDTS